MIGEPVWVRNVSTCRSWICCPGRANFDSVILSPFRPSSQFPLRFSRRWGRRVFRLYSFAGNSMAPSKQAMIANVEMTRQGPLPPWFSLTSLSLEASQRDSVTDLCTLDKGPVRSSRPDTCQIEAMLNLIRRVRSRPIFSTILDHVSSVAFLMLLSSVIAVTIIGYKRWPPLSSQRALLLF